MSQAPVQSSAGSTPAVYGAIARFAGPDALLDGARKVRRAGYRRFDVYTPYPVHGMDAAMGLGRSKLGWIVFGCGLAGAATALGLQWYCAAYDYPLITQGKPYFSWQAFVPVIFELMVLFAAFGAVIGMILLNGLPRWYHPVLKDELFARASEDGFFLTIEAGDPKFDAVKTKQLLKEIGGKSVGLLEE